jgi:hypothetical protein
MADTQRIFQETIQFLTDVGSSSYSPFVRAKDINVDVRTIYPVTAAMPAILPMTIATATSNGNRVEFTMLINPENINHGKTNATYSSYTRMGWVTQLWGPNQDLLTGTGRSAAFMVEGTGLSNFYKRQSIGFNNFMALLRSYRNNGYMLVDPTKLHTLTRVISLISGIEIFYDGQIFMGHFNNFTIDENAENPFIFNYNFEFVCSTLSQDYEEVRGHFSRVPAREGEKGQNKPVLMGDLLAQEEETGFFGS